MQCGYLHLILIMMAGWLGGWLVAISINFYCYFFGFSILLFAYLLVYILFLIQIIMNMMVASHSSNNQSSQSKAKHMILINSIPKLMLKVCKQRQISLFLSLICNRINISWTFINIWLNFFTPYLWIFFIFFI